jgi:agmatinase
MVFARVYSARGHEERHPGPDGPDSILTASAYVELYDEETDRQAADRGMHTLAEPILVPPGDEASGALLLVPLYRHGGLPVILGGSRSVSAAAMAASLDHDPSVDLLLLAGSFPVEGAAVPAALGGRSVRVAGLKSPPAEPPPGFSLLAPARELVEHPVRDPWETLGRHIHLSIHPDFFEPAVLPGPGNREPGGIDWWTALALVRALLRSRRLVGLDLSGHLPDPGLVHADFTLAKFLYRIVGYALERNPFLGEA